MLLLIYKFLAAMLNHKNKILISMTNQKLQLCSQNNACTYIL